MRIIKCKWLRNFVTKCLKSYYNKYKKKGDIMNNQTIIIIKKEKLNKTKPEKKEVNFKTINEALQPDLTELVEDNDLCTERHIVEEFLDTLNWIEDDEVQYPVDKVKELRSKLEEIIERISCFNDVLLDLGEEL